MTPIEKLQAEIRERLDPRCPWCDSAFYDGQRTELVGTHRWHVGCRNDHDEMAYETAATEGS